MKNTHEQFTIVFYKAVELQMFTAVENFNLKYMRKRVF